MLRRFWRGFEELVRGYWLFFLLVGVGLLASWPGRYADLAQAIATNVFATFLVLPFAILGIDRAVERAEERRRRPQRLAVLMELRGAVSRAVNLGATGTDPPVLAELKARIRREIRRTSDVEALGPVIAREVLNAEEYARAARRLSPKDLGHVIEEVSAERLEMLPLLAEARDALTPDLYAKVFAAVHGLGTLSRSSALMRSVTDIDPEAERPQTQALRDHSAGQLTDAMQALAQVTIRLHEIGHR